MKKSPISIISSIGFHLYRWPTVKLFIVVKTLEVKLVTQSF